MYQVPTSGMWQYFMCRRDITLCGDGICGVVLLKVFNVFIEQK